MSLSSFSTFSFYVFVTLTVLFLFLGAPIGCVNHLKRTADLVLWFPDSISVCTHPWHGRLYNLIVLKSSLNPSKLKFNLNITFGEMTWLHNCSLGFLKNFWIIYSPLAFDNHGDQVQGLSWHSDGGLVVTTCRDKKIRVLDPRSGSVVQVCTWQIIPNQLY